MRHPLTVIATSGPSDTYPKRAYRNPLDSLVRFLDSKHGDKWAIWEFRAEGTGYPDSAVYNRIWHYPYPDHHPPPFALIPNMMASMRNWLRAGNNSSTNNSNDNSKRNSSGDSDGVIAKGGSTGEASVNGNKDDKMEKSQDKGKDSNDNKSGGAAAFAEAVTAVTEAASKPPVGDGRVVVVHCKAGKGRSGTATCAYLISEEGWSMEDALQRFTERRMRPGWGAGVSIPSQLRWLRYVSRWAEHGKIYVERQVQVLEVHVWGLRDGVKVCVEGFVDEGRTIKVFHTFTREEREIVRGSLDHQTGFAELVQEVMKKRAGYTGKGKGAGGGAGKKDRATGHDSGTNSPTSPASALASGAATPASIPASSLATDVSSNNDKDNNDDDDQEQVDSADAVFRPAEKLVLPTNDINVDFERRNKAVSGWTVVTAVAHVWFNAFFEGNGPEQGGQADESGIFEIEWDAMDGIKGSSKKGTRAFDRIAVVWKTVPQEPPIVIREPGIGEEVPQSQPADWKGRQDDVSPGQGKHLGLRVSTPDSADISRANSVDEEHDAMHKHKHKEQEQQQQQQQRRQPADHEPQKGAGGVGGGSGNGMVASPLGSDDGTAGTRAHGPRGEATIHPPRGPLPLSSDLPQRTHELAREGESPPTVESEIIPFHSPQDTEPKPSADKVASGAAPHSGT